MKTAALTEVNRHIGVLAGGSPSDAREWEFFCECGDPDCHEMVKLTVETYAATHAGRLPILATGHDLTLVGRAKRARRAATDRDESAGALRGQAQQQVRRAQKNKSES